MFKRINLHTDAPLVSHHRASSGARGQEDGSGGDGTAPGITRFLGNELISAVSGEVVETKDALDGKIVGLYFAADWCKPCRQFTPLLAKYYSKVKDFKRKPFEIVWLSASREKGGYEAYRKEMPWLALPFEERQTFDVSKKCSKRKNRKSKPRLCLYVIVYTCLCLSSVRPNVT